MRKPKSSQQAKIDWLLAHQNLWEGFPWGQYGKHERQKVIVEAMKREGLVSKTTYYPDVALHNLIIEARRQRRVDSI